MKKVLLVLVLGLTFMSCSKEEISRDLVDELIQQEFYTEVNTAGWFGKRFFKSETDLEDNSITINNVFYVYTEECVFSSDLVFTDKQVITSTKDVYEVMYTYDDEVNYYYTFTYKMKMEGDALIVIRSYDGGSEATAYIKENIFTDYNICD